MQTLTASTPEVLLDEEPSPLNGGSMEHPATDVGGYIFSLATLHGVSYVKTSYDELSEVITRLSDDDVVMDEIEQLLIALERAGVIPSEAAVPLHLNYLREKSNVRPI